MTRINESFCSRMGRPRKPNHKPYNIFIDTQVRDEFKKYTKEEFGVSASHVAQELFLRYVNSVRKKKGLEPIILDMTEDGREKK